MAYEYYTCLYGEKSRFFVTFHLLLFRKRATPNKNISLNLKNAITPYIY